MRTPILPANMKIHLITSKTLCIISKMLRDLMMKKNSMMMKMKMFSKTTGE
jgi:uridine kinase